MTKPARSKRRRRRQSPGASPGTLIQHAEAASATVHVTAFGPDGIVERTITDLAEVKALRGQHPLVWLDVIGVEDAGVLRELGEQFGLHRLALEDIQNVHQRTKVEVYEGSTHLALRMAWWDGGLVSEQLSIVLGPKWVITFQERPGDCFDPVRLRLREGRGRLRSAGADYLAYALMDAVVDNYFPMLDHLTEAVDALEEEVLTGSRDGFGARVQLLRRDVMTLRRAIWPLRDVISSLQREPSELISDDTRLFLRDCHDHSVQVMDLIENCRERGAMAMELHNSAISQRMNEIMKVLTIISTIFIPLSFVAGVYGMNFDREASGWNMPELGWRFGYPLVVGGMVALAGGMVWFFRSKGWLGGVRSSGD